MNWPRQEGNFLSGREGALGISRGGGMLRQRIGRCWGSRSALSRRRWRGVGSGVRLRVSSGN